MNRDYIKIETLKIYTFYNKLWKKKKEKATNQIYVTSNWTWL